MKTILIGILSLVTAFSTSAQKKSTVTLKNGSIIKGNVLVKTDSVIKIETKDGSIWQYTAEDVLSVENYNHTEGKTYSILNVGFLPAQNVSRSLHIINGYRFNKHWQTGIGFGVEDIAGTSYIPMFMHGQYNFLTSNTTPFVSVLVGYEMALSNQEYNKGGFTTGAKVGINHYFSEHVGISTSFGYRYGYFKQENSFGWWSTPTTVIREINRFEFRFGLVFK